MLAKIRFVLWGLVAAAVGLTLGLFVLNKDITAPDGAGRSGLLGGPFTLTRTDGSTFTEKDLADAPYAIFFGFTHCPEICPTTLYEMSGWIEELGADADRMKFVFVTIDPERDTAELLGDYVDSFSEKVIALTGTVEQVDVVKKLYRVYAAKVPLDDGDYTMDHTASVYLMDAKGDFTGTVAFGEAPGAAVEKLRKLVGAGS